MKKRSVFYSFTFFAILLFTAGLIFHPQTTAEAVRNALGLCIRSVIPSLFPFLFLASFSTNLNLTELLNKALNRIMRPLFSLSGASSSALALGLIGGYPVGAATAASLYSQRLCSEEEVERLLAFCNNCGPAFIIGTVGCGVFSSSKTGILLLIIHILSALAVGLIFRFFSPLKNNRATFKSNSGYTSVSFSKAFTNAVSSALKSSLNIISYIVLFSVVITILNLFKIIPLLSNFISMLSGAESGLIEDIISGMLEMTVGIYALPRHATMRTAFIITAFLIGWGGLSVHFQALSFISEYNLSTHQYFIGKLLQGIISALLAAALAFHRPSTPAFASITVTKANNYELFPVIFSVILIFIFLFCKKGWKKRR